jgi:RecB family endonuclease NucS
MFDRYYAFRKLMDLVNDYYNVTDATTNNYAGDIEIIGKDENGSTMTIRVHLEEGKKDA